MTELLVFDKKWFEHHQNDEVSLTNFYHMINKGFSKPKHKYQVIGSSRVKSPTGFIKENGILFTKEYYFVMLLGSKKVFDELNERDQYTRDFTVENDTLEQSLACDIPQQYHDLFPIAEDTSTIIRADRDFIYDDETVSRTLAATAFYIDDEYEDGHFLSEMSSFVSYIKNGAPRLLQIVIDKFLLPELDIPIIRIEIGCIKEHELASYYHKKCQFKFSHKQDIFCELIGDELFNCPFKDNVVAYKSFTITHLYRDFYRKS